MQGNVLTPKVREVSLGGRAAQQEQTGWNYRLTCLGVVMMVTGSWGENEGRATQTIVLRVLAEKGAERCRERVEVWRNMDTDGSDD